MSRLGGQDVLDLGYDTGYASRCPPGARAAFRGVDIRAAPATAAADVGRRANTRLQPRPVQQQATTHATAASIFEVIEHLPNLFVGPHAADRLVAPVDTIVASFPKLPVSTASTASTSGA